MNAYEPSKDPTLKESLYRLDECLREAVQHARKLEEICVEGETDEMARQLSDCTRVIHMSVSRHVGVVHASTTFDRVLHEQYRKRWKDITVRYLQNIANKFHRSNQ